MAGSSLTIGDRSIMNNIEPERLEFTVEKRFGFLALYVRDVNKTPDGDKRVYGVWRKATKSELPEIVKRLGVE